MRARGRVGARHRLQSGARIPPAAANLLRAQEARTQLGGQQLAAGHDAGAISIAHGAVVRHRLDEATQSSQQLLEGG